MTYEQYEAAVRSALNEGKYSGVSNRWNQEFRANLRYYGLTLTSVRPMDDRCVEAPWPTWQDDGCMDKHHTPETDPYAWDIPSWIVERPITTGRAI